ncbi:MAG: DUF2283 domain-containing protein [Candidatus Hydrogenedentes bacterium]|nr:DUF2283 domain-containing protein [Candidatus Hydrogenedentota bacterium]
MKVTHDSKSDALYIELKPLAPGTASNQPLNDDITIDCGPDGKVAGIEIIDASEVLGEHLDRLTLEIAPALRARSAWRSALNPWSLPHAAEIRQSKYSDANQYGCA